MDSRLFAKAVAAEPGDSAALHVLIAGPAGSGKMTQAVEYAALLAARGLASRNVGVADYAHEDPSGRLWRGEFEAAQGGVMIVKIRICYGAAMMNRSTPISTIQSGARTARWCW